MIFAWLRRRRRRRLLAEPAPTAWDAWLEADFAHWRALDDDDRGRLRDITRVIVAEKKWRATGGLEMTEHIKVLVAAQAGLLLLGLEHDYYRNVASVVVHPTGYAIDRADDNLGALGVTRKVPVLGHASPHGPVVVAWHAAKSGAIDPIDGRNLVYHEFAHKLDMLDGVVDGTPPLQSQRQGRAWFDLMSRAYEQLRRDARRGRRTLLDDYGATNVAEFFAVATETFFEKPRRMRTQHEDLYSVLRDFYGQDPAERSLRAASRR